jgi:uncharacterized protein YndB with AHSA1/START domain
MGAVSTASDALRLRVRIEAPPDALVKAITEPDLMTEWLAESVEAAPDRYEFWGRYVPQGDRPRQRLIAIDPARGVRFAWDLDGAVPAGSAGGGKSEVDLSVDGAEAAGERGSVVALSHAGYPADSHTALNAFWHLALANLAARGEGYPTTPPLDFTLPAHGEALVRAVIAVPPEEVYACLLDAERIGRLAGTTATIEPEVGGRYDLGWERGPVRITDLVPDRAMTLAWRQPELAETVVRWDLRTAHGYTYLTLVHGEFTDDHLAEDLRRRWVPLLVELKRMLELGERWAPMGR